MTEITPKEAGSSPSTPAPAAEPKNTEPPGAEKETAIPYARFKEVNDQLKGVQEEMRKLKEAQALAAQEAETKRLATLPELERLKEQAGKVETAQAEAKALQASMKALQDTLESYLKSELEGVSAEHRKGIEGMASDPAGQLKALALLRSSGLLGPKAIIPTHNGKPGATGAAKPLSREEARSAMLRALSGKK